MEYLRQFNLNSSPVWFKISLSIVVRQIWGINYHCNRIALSGYCQEGYTQKEKELIPKLRELAGDALYAYWLREDYILANFLRASNLNVAEANKMLREAIKWRLENNIEAIVNETILPELFQPRFDGKDKIGRPIAYLSPARWDIRKVLLAGQREELIRIFLRICEAMNLKLQEARNATGKDLGNTVLVLDNHGYNLRQHACLTCFSVYFDWVRNYEKYYPQGLGHFFMINTPRIFTPLLELLKGIFSSHTQKILKVLGPREQWLPELLKVIDRDQLLQHYGGTKV